MANRLQELEKNLGLVFKNHDLLKLTMIHRSYINERSSAHESNERLEFLGDAVLSLIVADYLFKTQPERPEGELTDLRSALVRRETLAKFARNFNLGHFLYLGKGEAQTGGRTRSLTLASAFEAVLGAIYLEHGFEGAQKWLIPIIEPELQEILAEGRHLDFKGLLQKTTQQRYQQTPHYEVVATSGPEHEPVFEIEVLLGDRPLARGSGSTKLIAQQAAAREALQVLQSEAVEETEQPPAATSPVDSLLEQITSDEMNNGENQL
ncbi:MAG TPA: ribonuclease III [Chloroflexia bacterium]|nr:ribonuclease III [Chloroflexia bacterium]